MLAQSTAQADLIPINPVIVDVAGMVTVTSLFSSNFLLQNGLLGRRYTVLRWSGGFIVNISWYLSNYSRKVWRDNDKFTNKKKILQIIKTNGKMNMPTRQQANTGRSSKLQWEERGERRERKKLVLFELGTR